ncbi:MAG: flagellar filament capping protein FliD [Treponema sp.]|nr:flagellar filament capping protein FliD [Treponema sp.]
MSDVYMPGLRSRFNSEKTIEDLMRIERIPKDRAEKNVESLETRKVWWQDLGRRITSLRESAQLLYSFQNPFNDRVVLSSNDNVITATATREAEEREYQFTVKQLAQADRFLSAPMDEKTRVEAGTYIFSLGKDEISFNFKGGTIREFADALNRQGRNRISASLITVQPGSRSLLLESKITGAENQLGFSGDAERLAFQLGMAEKVDYFRKEYDLNEGTVTDTTPNGGEQPPESIFINDGILNVPPLASATVQLGADVKRGSPLIFKLETATRLREAAETFQAAAVSPAGNAADEENSLIETTEEDSVAEALPEWTPAPRTDNFTVLSLIFSDGSKAALPVITDTEDFLSREYDLSELAGGKTITALSVDNSNTHREIQIRGALIFDPSADNKTHQPLRAVSTAQDAVISMEGIEITRPSNIINDIIPGITVTARSVSAYPERLDVRPNREGVKDAIISLVGNYNRLIAELNVLTRTDDRLVDELTYLDKDEVDEMRKRLGAFSAETAVTQFRSNLLRTVSSPYPTGDDHDITMLAQIGISTNPGSTGGAAYNPSRLRGYLDIDPKVLDTAIEQNLPAIRQLFAYDTTGDLLADTGVAYNLDAVSKPFVELGGIVSLKTRTIDSRISQDKRRIDTMERQLAMKEADLKIQYSRMESAYDRMERMSSSLDNFSQRNNNR